MYVASVGGNPGGGQNSAVTEIAVLGQCPAAGNFDSTLTGVFISEISTVAAAYALQAYSVDTFDIGAPSSTTLQQTGIANAFANAANLFDVQNVNGFARTTTVSGNGTVPQLKIHTLANILAACVNSTGASSAACSSLLSAAKSAGTSGTAPTDVATAAINIARNPWANVSTLFNIPTSITPFSPQLASAPNDFTLSLSFANAALGNNPSLAIDSGGNIWTVVPGQTAVTKLSPMGALLSGGTGYAIGGGFANAHGLAVDTSNNLWILGKSTSSPAVPQFAELNNTGVYQKMLTESSAGTYTHPPASATNLVLYSSYISYTSARQTGGTPGTACCTVLYTLGSGSFTDLDSGNSTPGTNFIAGNGSTAWTTGNGSTVSLYSGISKGVTGGGLSGAVGVALDHSANAWFANSGNNSISEFNSAGTAISGSSGYTGGLTAPGAIAICGLGNVWVSNSGSANGLSQFTSAGVAVGTGFHSPYLSNSSALSIDGSGNIWVASSTSGTLVEFVGVAAPVVTPMAAAVNGAALGIRP